MKTKQTEAKAKHAGGRPSAYQADYPARVLAFMDEMTADNFDRHCSKPHIGVLLGVCTDTILEWEKKYPEFSGAIKRWETKRNAVHYEVKRMSDARWIFLKKNWEGMSDKQAVEHTGEGGGPVRVQVERVITRDRDNAGPSGGD